MPSKRRGKRIQVPAARMALDRMKWEIASEIGAPTHLVQGDYWGDVSSRDCGLIGGNMVRKMIEAAQASLASTTSAGVSRGFHEVVDGTPRATHVSDDANRWPEGYHTGGYPTE